jgi:hypothetical protein
MGVGGAVERIDDDHHARAVRRAAAALLREHADTRRVEHAVGGGVGHQVGPVLPGDGARQAPVAARGQGGGHSVGRLVEEHQHTLGVRGRCALHRGDDGGRL